MYRSTLLCCRTSAGNVAEGLEYGPHPPPWCIANYLEIIVIQGSSTLPGSGSKCQYPLKSDQCMQSLQFYDISLIRILYNTQTFLTLHTEYQFRAPFRKPWAEPLCYLSHDHKLMHSVPYSLKPHASHLAINLQWYLIMSHCQITFQINKCKESVHVYLNTLCISASTIHESILHQAVPPW